LESRRGPREKQGEKGNLGARAIKAIRQKRGAENIHNITRVI